MNPLTSDAALDVLGQLHARLDAHFRGLQASRLALDADAPGFALEHGLSSTDLDALCAAVRHAVAQGFDHRYWRQNWLPFIVYAAESGYDYIGGEYWLSFEQSTPGWAQYGSRDRIRMWFRKFNTESRSSRSPGRSPVTGSSCRRGESPRRGGGCYTPTHETLDDRDPR